MTTNAAVKELQRRSRRSAGGELIAGGGSSQARLPGVDADAERQGPIVYRLSPGGWPEGTRPVAHGAVVVRHGPRSRAERVLGLVVLSNDRRGARAIVSLEVRQP